MRKLIALSVLVLGLYFGLIATSTAQAKSLLVPHKPWKTLTIKQKINVLKKQIHKDHSVIRWWKNHEHIKGVTWKEVHWATISLRIATKNLKKYTYRPSYVSAESGVIGGLLCIHSHEGSWSDPGSPYWGGLQMDYSFQSTYGPEFLNKWGTADNWPVWAQLKAGVRGYHARGWSPWYNTAHMCGLI